MGGKGASSTDNSNKRQMDGAGSCAVVLSVSVLEV